MNELEIIVEKKGDDLLLKCSGRLDANRAGHLNDYIDQLVRDGQYQILLDLTAVDYLSSAGIRSLIMQNKNLKAVNGYFYIAEMSDNVRQVLTMVGLSDLLSRKPEETKKTEQNIKQAETLNASGFNFHISGLKMHHQTKVSVFGDPELIKTSAYTAKDSHSVKASENQFSIGLGALGDSFEDCKNRFGEYIQLGKNLAYLPGDGSKKPDYILGTGQLIASFTALYGINFTGEFSHLVRFESENNRDTICLSDLSENLSKIAGSQQFAIVMIAESAGLIGASLNASPVGGKSIFTFPEIKETINFTTEPAHNKALTITVGLISDDSKVEIMKFLRPIIPLKPVFAHLHTAVFTYLPIKKTDINLNETIDYLFDTSELKDILHLTNDIREITGQGESRFVHGFCWIAPIEKSDNI
ncbi:MAG: STAS domain-containing protein [Bacteroidales bacterium]